MFKVISNVKKFIDIRQITTRITAEGKDVPKKKILENRITLIGADNSITITDLKNAQNLSTRRELKLVKIQDADSKTRRPVYKLMTIAQYHEEELARRKEKQASKENLVKGDKLLTISTKIAEHDLMTRIRKIGKLLEKKYEVRVVINGEENEGDAKAEKIYTIVENNLKSSGRIVQKRNKGSTLRFQVLPLKDSGDGSDNNKQDNDKGPL